MATPPAANRGFSISAGCPACGGELQLDENFSVTHCDHCGSVIRLRLPSTPPAWLVRCRIDRLRVRFFVDRHLTERARPLSDPALEIEGFYAPYWKIDALLLRLRHHIDKRLVFSDVGAAQDVREIEQEASSTLLSPYSVTIAAVAAVLPVPASLGLRAEIMKLRPFATEIVDGDFALLEPTLNEAGAVARAVEIAANLDRLTTSTNRRNSSRLFAQRSGIIYQPFYLVRGRSGENRLSLLVDATNGDVGEWSSRAALESSSGTGAGFAAVQVELHQCGNCGSGLPEVNSLLHVCPDCDNVVLLDPEIRTGQPPLLFGPIAEAHNELFPFWILPLSGDIAARVRRHIGATNPVTNLVVPAFPLRNYETLYKLSLRMTAAITQFTPQESDAWPVGAAPVAVSASRARALASAIVARSVAAREGKIDAAAACGFAEANPRLLLASFREEGYFFMDDHLNVVTFERAALS